MLALEADATKECAEDDGRQPSCQQLELSGKIPEAQILSSPSDHLEVALASGRDHVPSLLEADAPKDCADCLGRRSLKLASQNGLTAASGQGTWVTLHLISVHGETLCLRRAPLASGTRS